MNRELFHLLARWPQSWIRSQDLAVALGGTEDRRYALVKRAFQDGWLLSLCRGLYLIGEPLRSGPIPHYTLAHLIAGPSTVSFSSALFLHGWTKEAPASTTCTLPRRTLKVDSPLGTYSYLRVPSAHFFLGVHPFHLDDERFLLADPWRAIADYAYVHQAQWTDREALCRDLQLSAPFPVVTDSLDILIESYPSTRVRSLLKRVAKESLALV